MLPNLLSVLTCAIRDPRTNKEDYRGDVDGLRAIAVVAVMLFHADLGLLHGGFVGVDIFFVISGFVITRTIYKQISANHFSLLKFYEHRILRIFPAMLAMLATVLAAGYVVLLPDDFNSLGATSFFAAASVSNWELYYRNDYFDTASEFNPLLHTWSLAIEEQFYLIFPLLLAISMRAGTRAARLILSAVLCLSLAASIYRTPIDASASFFHTQYRIWELLTGALLAMGLMPTLTNVKHLHALSVIGALLVVASLLFYSPDMRFPGLAAIPPTLGTAMLIYAGGLHSTHTTRVLASQPIVAIGLISYSLYLWHWPVFAYLRYATVNEVLPTSLSLFGLVASSVLGYVSWRFIEMPIRFGTFSTRQIFIGGSMAAVVIAGLSALVAHLDGMPWRLDPDTLRIASRDADNRKISFQCADQPPQPSTLDPDCIIGAHGSEPISVLVWGDSHSATLRPAFDNVLTGIGRKGAAFSHNACPPIVNIDINRIHNGSTTWCQNFNNHVLAWIRANPSVEIVVLSSNWMMIPSRQEVDYSPEIKDSATSLDTKSLFREALREQIRTITAEGRKIILINQIPPAAKDVPLALVMERRLGLELEPQQRLTTILENNAWLQKALNSLARKNRVSLFSPHEILCSSDCIISHNGEPLYFDKGHLTKLGASLLEPRLKTAVTAALGEP